MARRIVQMLVTCAVDTNTTRAEIRDGVAGVLVTILDEALVELVESGGSER